MDKWIGRWKDDVILIISSSRKKSFWRNGMISFLSMSYRISFGYVWKKCFPGGSVGKESTCNAEDAGSISGSGRSPGGGHGNPLQYSCLENSQTEEPGGLQSIGLQRVGHDCKGCKELKRLSTYAHMWKKRKVTMAFQKCLFSFHVSRVQGQALVCWPGTTTVFGDSVFSLVAPSTS